jgi:death-on-curing protein
LPSEPCWLDPDGIVRLNERLVALTSEPHCLVSRSLLESGCGRAQNRWLYEHEEDVAVLATELLFGIARNHPFLQGNKRTGFAAMIGFLAANGYRFLLQDDTDCADYIIAVLEGRATEESFADILRHKIEAVRDWGA